MGRNAKQRTDTFGNMLNNYKKPTPLRWRRVGDALLAVSLVAVPAELSGHTWLSISVFLVGVIGKFLTNLFSDESA